MKNFSRFMSLFGVMVQTIFAVESKHTDVVRAEQQMHQALFADKLNEFVSSPDTSIPNTFDHVYTDNDGYCYGLSSAFLGWSMQGPKKMDEFSTVLKILAHCKDIKCVYNAPAGHFGKTMREAIDMIVSMQNGNVMGEADTLVTNLAPAYDYSLINTSDADSVYRPDGLHALLETFFKLFPHRMQGVRVGYRPLNRQGGHSVSIVKRPGSDHCVFYDPNIMEGPCDRNLNNIVQCIYSNNKTNKFAYVGCSFFWDKNQANGGSDEVSEKKRVDLAVQSIRHSQQKIIAEDMQRQLEDVQRQLWGVSTPGQWSHGSMVPAFFLRTICDYFRPVAWQSVGISQINEDSSEYYLIFLLTSLVDPILDHIHPRIRSVVAEKLLGHLVPQLVQLVDKGCITFPDHMGKVSVHNVKEAFDKIQKEFVQLQHEKTQTYSKDHYIYDRDSAQQAMKELIKDLFTEVAFENRGAKEWWLRAQFDSFVLAKTAAVIRKQLYYLDTKPYVSNNPANNVEANLAQDSQEVIEELFANRTDRALYEDKIKIFMNALTR